MTTSHHSEPTNEKAWRPKHESEHPDEIADEHAAGATVKPTGQAGHAEVVSIPRGDAERKLPPDPDPDDPVSP